MDQIVEWLDHLWLATLGISDGLATLIAGILALLAGVLAWRAIRDQIKEQRKSEERTLTHAKQTLKQAFTAEIIAYIPKLYRDLSYFNSHAHFLPRSNADLQEPFRDAVVYRELIGRIGELHDVQHASLLVEFHSNLADFNDLVRMQQTHGVSNFDFACPLQRVARNAADLLRSLHPDGSFPLHPGFPPEQLMCPDGQTAARHQPVNMIQLLRFMGGAGPNGEIGSANPDLNPEPPIGRKTPVTGIAQGKKFQS